MLLEVEEKNGQIEVRTRLSIDRARIPPGDYAAWRAFCQAVDASAGAATAGGTGDVRPDDVDFVDGVNVDTLTGGSEEGTADGDVEAARFSNPASIVRIDERMFVVADYDSGRLRMLDVEGNTSTVEGPDGFSQPYGLASLDGGVFVQTDTNSRGGKDRSVSVSIKTAAG